MTYQTTVSASMTMTM